MNRTKAINDLIHLAEGSDALRQVILKETLIRVSDMDLVTLLMEIDAIVKETAERRKEAGQ